MGPLVPVLAFFLLSCVAPAHQQSDEETDSLPLTPPIASAEVVEQNDATCPSAEAQNVVKETLQPLILSTSNTLVPCTLRVIGQVFHCPASNCSELFNLAQEEGLIFLSNYYWLVGTTGEVRKVYCNRDTQQPEYSSCGDLFELYNLPSGVYTIHPSRGSPVTVYCDFESEETVYFSCNDIHQIHPDLSSGNYTIRPSGGSPVIVYCNNETREAEYFVVSCASIRQIHPDLPSGNYTIRPSGGSPVTVYCDVDSEECGGGVWTRVASYNYSDPNISCPNNWAQMTEPFRGCTVHFQNPGCFSSLFPTPVEYSQVCGRVTGVQHNTPEAFTGPDDINSNYVEGVSITHSTPRQHIWTLAAYPFDAENTVSYLCPCSQPSMNVPLPPSFVGNNYFCDTGYGIGDQSQDAWFTVDPLWDGQGCSSTSTCCSFNNPPWFSTTLPQSTTDDIEVRICQNDPSRNDHTAITQLDLYIK